MAKKLRKVIEQLFWRYYYFSVENILARAIRSLGPLESIADMGCGDGELFKRLHAIVHLPKKSLGMDIFFPVIASLSKDKIRHRWLINADASRIPLKERSFEAVFSSHMVEHLEKKSDIVGVLTKIASRGVVIITPLGITDFSFDPSLDKENPFQKHHCGYGIDDFKRMGFRVYGIGVRGVCGAAYKKGKIPVFIRPLFSFFSLLFTFFTYYFPHYADHLFCVKHVDP